MDNDFYNSQYFSDDSSANTLAHTTSSSEAISDSGSLNPYGMKEAEYQSYVIGCQDASDVCADYMAYYTKYPNAPFAL